MSQLYTYRGFSLRRAAVHTKVMITAFLLTVSLAIAVGVINYRVRTGLTPSGSVLWYRGNGGAGEGAIYEKTPLELLDATHPHLFGQAFLFFVLCHLFALTPVRAGLKVALYSASFLAVLIDAGSPWLIRYVHPAFAWLQIAGNLLTVSCFLVLAIVPLREMWLIPRGAPEPREIEL